MKIVVYCSAKDAIPEEYLALGDALGAWIGVNGHVLVYGGATGGLMTRVSESCKAVGGYVIGVVPAKIINSGRKAHNCDELYYVRKIAERKQAMRDMGDVTICLPGSYGTLDEMMDVISSATIGEHHKPLYVLNYKGFYDPLIRQIEIMRSLHFIPEQEAFKPIFVDTLEEFHQEIINHKS